MKTIYQVVNEFGNPASREGNDEAIFLDIEKAKEHIEFLINDCGLNDVEFTIIDLYNFESWHETHFEMTQAIARSEHLSGSTANKIVTEQGTGGLYDLARQLTDKFETQHKNTIWGEDLIYQDELSNFLDQEL